MKAGNERIANSKYQKGLRASQAQGPGDCKEADGWWNPRKIKEKFSKYKSFKTPDRHTNTTVNFINSLYRYTSNCVHYENCVLLGYYAASSSNFLLMLQDNLSVPSSRSKNPKRFLNPED
jgi:hypothetical protein